MVEKEGKRKEIYLKVVVVVKNKEKKGKRSKDSLKQLVRRLES